MKKKSEFTIKGYPIIKFQDLEYARSTQTGKLYMKTLGWYREHENKSGDMIIGDEREGKMNINDAIFIIPEQNVVEKIDNQGISTIIEDSYAFCMFEIRNFEDCFEFSQEQKKKIKEFGDSALIITDTEEFKRRIVTAAEKYGYKVKIGYMNYLEDNGDDIKYILSLKNDIRNVAFWKRADPYQYQQEFRILIENGKKEEYVILEIEDISDISVIKSSEAVLEGRVVKHKDI